MSYRKIYEKHYGPIPIDKGGRSFDIHHIDGKHKNDLLVNLTALSIQEHYDIHFSQGDWAACQLILIRMNQSPEEISKQCSKIQKKRISDGTHNFITNHPNADGKVSKRLVSNRTHNFLGPENNKKNNKKRIVAGTHNFLNGEFQREVQKKRISDGTHNFLVKIICPHCSKTGHSAIMKRWHFDNCKLKPIN